MYITPLTIMDVDMYVVCLKLNDEYRYTNHLSKSLDAQINDTRPPIISHINRGTNKNEITHRAIG